MLPTTRQLETRTRSPPDEALAFSLGQRLDLGQRERWLVRRRLVRGQLGTCFLRAANRLRERKRDATGESSDDESEDERSAATPAQHQAILLLPSSSSIAYTRRIVAPSDRHASFARQLAHLALILPLALASSAPVARAADPKPGTTTAIVTTAPVYRPPARGKPRGRVGGGTRGAGAPLGALTALVPDHTGETLAAQPALFWNLAALPAGNAKLLFVLANDESVEPLVEVELARPDAAGIQRTDLAAYGVELRTGVEYEWSVTLASDPARRSSDVVTVGWIERVEAPPGLSATDPATLAAAGLWYDAFAAASPELRRQLLREAGLDVGAAAP